MQIATIAIATTLTLISANVEAQDVKQCDFSLQPTIMTAEREYSVIQSYMFLNAAHEYDKLLKESSGNRGASASYKLFSAEFHDSKSSSEFQEKVRKRLTSEGYSLNEAESRASYRRFLTQEQLEAWASCVRAVTQSGAVLLQPISPHPSGFPLKVDWYPQKGKGTEPLVLEIRNGTINKRNLLKVPLTGVSSRTFIVVPDRVKPGATPVQLVITASIAGASDELAMPLQFPDAKPPTTLVPMTLRRECSGGRLSLHNYAHDHVCVTEPFRPSRDQTATVRITFGYEGSPSSRLRIQDGVKYGLTPWTSYRGTGEYQDVISGPAREALFTMPVSAGNDYVFGIRIQSHHGPGNPDVRSHKGKIEVTFN